MAAASAGRVRNVHTLAEAYCNLIMASTERRRLGPRLGVVRPGRRVRARARRRCPLLGACRTIHADVLVARGRWPEAEHGARDGAGDARPLRARDGRARPWPAWPSCGCARAGWPRPSSCWPGARSTRRRCARWPTCASPTASRGWRRRCWSAPSPAAEGDAIRTTAAAGPAGGGAAGLRRHPGRRGRPPAQLAELAEAAPASGWSGPARELAAAHVHLAAGPRRRGGRARAPGAGRVRAGWACRSTWARRGWRWPGRWWPTSPDVARDEARAALDAFRELGAVAGHGRRRGRAARARRGHRRPRRAARAS